MIHTNFLGHLSRANSWTYKKFVFCNLTTGKHLVYTTEVDDDEGFQRVLQ